MPISYDLVEQELKKNPKNWLVTGAAGFIGSNLCERLLLLNQKVIGLDNFSTGYSVNLESFKENKNFTFIEGDITDLNTCLTSMKSCEYVLHQAALGSVPRSIETPLKTHETNVNGQLNILKAAVDNKINKVVYASSSSIYGDNEILPKIESAIGNPLSPYAATKRINEIYADVFFRSYKLNSIGLRYFNVFGKKQSPEGPYAAVIPLWIEAITKNQEVFINGDGSTSRDFCFVENVIQANILAAYNNVNGANLLNISCGGNITLLNLFELIRDAYQAQTGKPYTKNPVFRNFREGDIKHSQATINKAKELIAYSPTCEVAEGISQTVSWFLKTKA